MEITQNGIFCVRLSEFVEEDLVEARRADVENAEAVAALLHLVERLHLAVHQERVPEQAVEVERVEDEQSRGRDR